MRLHVLVFYLLFLTPFLACEKKQSSEPPTTFDKSPTGQIAELPPGMTPPTVPSSLIKVSGWVSTTQKASAPKTIRMSADAACLKAHEGKTVTAQDLLIDPSGGLANVFVYLKEGVKAGAASDLPPVVLDQQGCLYTPHVLGIQVGQPLKILNSDPMLHNVNALAKTNKAFNVGMATKGQSVEKKFDKPEVMIRFKCDVHGWMAAFIGVLDHPYFAVSKSDGSFSLPDLAPGEYTLEAWHEKLGTKTSKLTVTAGMAPINITF